MNTPNMSNPFESLSRLAILPQFLNKKEKEYKKLQGYILDKSISEVRLKTDDIQGVIEDSPYEPYQKSFHLYFFESILGENNVMKNAKNLFAPNEEMTNWQFGGYYDHINTFFSTFTNMQEITKAFLKIVRSIPEKQIVVIADKKLANLYYCYFLYLRVNGYTRKEVSKNFHIFDGTVLVIEPDVPAREIQLKYG